MKLFSEGYLIDKAISALEKAHYELNAIRARDGAPQHIDWYRGRPLQTSTVTEEYFSDVVDECYATLELLKLSFSPQQQQDLEQ